MKDPYWGESDRPYSNKELGTEYVHSRQTGENFLASYATDYQQNGPQGPGYYRHGEKLEIGRSD